MKVSNIRYVPGQRNTVRPRQGIDIFKKRMEETFSSPEAAKLEFQNSGIKHTKIIMQNICIFMFFLIIILSGVYADKKFTSEISFCSPSNKENCRPCPEFGLCENDNLKCIKNFIKEGNECVEDRALIQKAYGLLHKVEDYIIEKATDQYLLDRNSFYATLTEIKQLFQDSENVNDKFLELLVNNKAQRLIIKYYNSEEVFYPKEPFLGVISLAKVF